MFNGRQDFKFNGHFAGEYGIVATGLRVYGAPTWDVERQAIPGKNGEIIRTRDRLQNIIIEYPIAIADGFEANALEIKSWLMSGKGGYARLEDNYNPEFFRLASFAGPVDFDVCNWCNSGEAVLQFSCKPQLFRRDAQKPVEIKDGRIFNPYAFDAKPMIEIVNAPSGSTLTVNHTACKIVKGAEIFRPYYIDCEEQETGTAPGRWDANDAVYIPEYPTLAPGWNEITLDKQGQYAPVIKITPRWWTL